MNYIKYRKNILECLQIWNNYIIFAKKIDMEKNINEAFENYNVVSSLIGTSKQVDFYTGAKWVLDKIRDEVMRRKKMNFDNKQKSLALEDNDILMFIDSLESKS